MDDYVQMGFAVDTQEPNLYLGRAENMTEIQYSSVDIFVTSPPYNLKHSNWNMGGQGRTPRNNGIGFEDDMPEDDYQLWQIECLKEMYRVAVDGASLFYNHKNRQRDNRMISPWEWIHPLLNPWTVRQEIIWHKGGTHNHNSGYFWPETERIYWMYKGDKPALYNNNIGMSDYWRIPMRRPTWHPAPFPGEVPKRCLKAIGGQGLTVLDPFAGSCTSLSVALDMGHLAIGYDVNKEYLTKAAIMNGWLNQAELLGAR